jgi:energy-coupling factor transporter ATP-binding protein EcfA2
MEGGTAIVIAHRLSTVRFADRIIVLEKGVIRKRAVMKRSWPLAGITPSSTRPISATRAWNMWKPRGGWGTAAKRELRAPFGVHGEKKGPPAPVPTINRCLDVTWAGRGLP